MTRPRPSDESDAEASLPGVRRGDPDEVDRWYRSEFPDVYRLCTGFLADATEAEDLAQEVMLHLIDHLGAWDGRRSYARWRDTVVLNRCRDRLRRAGARRRAERAAAEHALPATLPDPSAEASRAEVRAILEQSLSALSPREREAFVLRDLEGVATAEVAAAMGVREASVRSLLTLARRRLRRLLGERLPCSAGEERP